MEEDVLNALQTRTAYLPGGFDRDGKIIVVVSILNDLQLWNRRYLELSISYLKRTLSPTILLKGVTVIVDAQKSTRRITRAHARTIYALFGDLSVNLFLVRAEGFWEKHLDPCTKSQTANEPVVLAMSRLSKYFELDNLPLELGGTLHFNYDLWLQQRKAIDEFQKTYEQTLNSMDNLHIYLLNSKSLHPAEAAVEVKNCAEMHATVQQNIDVTIDRGNRILLRLGEVYTQPLRSKSRHKTETTSSLSSNLSNSPTLSTPTMEHLPVVRCPLPPDLNCERSRIELRLNAIERKQTEIRTAWLELLRSLRETRELTAMEEGVSFVTNWILNTAEELLSRQQLVGGDIGTCEALRIAHDALEMECRGTYGYYAELLYKIDTFKGTKDSYAYRDLMSQKDFMNFVCRSFAQRLERRRNILITSLRFFRLVTEYFEQTTTVFETLVMGNSLRDNLGVAAEQLQKLKESQASLVHIERELIREGEKLSDMLSMPVKDALGRDLHIDYSEDIHNIRQVLDTTIARRNLFGDSVELQKLTLEQVTHIHAYEEDARMAIQWMIDLYNVMIKYHSHVGCSIHEIQVQKDELQMFQETGKSIYNYGCQLLEASQALRTSCRLDLTEAQTLWSQLLRIWRSLQAISQEHMTRLRVSAVFHRSVEEYCQQMIALEMAVRGLWNSTYASTSSAAVNNENTAANITVSSSGIGSLSEASIRTTATDELRPTPSEDDVHDDYRRDQLQKYLAEREQLLLEVGRMVRLGRLLKTRLKEPFILDAITGESVNSEDLTSEAPATPIVSTPTSLEERIAQDANNVDKTQVGEDQPATPSLSLVTPTTPISTVVINPTDNNNIACNAISQKLNDIATVAGSLDAAIRDVQNGADATESNSSTSSSEKKPNPSMSSSSEDWHSRSTEDDSFATASEGNFTPHSHSSSFQTASAHNSLLQGSSSKNSFEANDEADDSTLSAYDIPELASSSNNVSFDSSDRSFFSAQQDPLLSSSLTIEPNSSVDFFEDGNSVADVEELHSQSVTPTPGDEHFQSIPVESESEIESNIADAPSMKVLTEETPAPITSITPESPDKLYIKVVELEPKITTLGRNIEESIQLQRDHDETLRNIQNLPGPMDEFVQKADKLLASKRISSELVNALADTLNIIWQDVLHLLHDRQHILHLCTQYHEKMLLCLRSMDQLEVACVETVVPIEVGAVQEFLNRFKQMRIDMLTAVMAALKDGNELLAQLQDLSKMETLDTRPEHIKRDALRAVHQVQQWLESLHDRRNALEIAWQTRKNQLEQCLTLALLGRELDEVEAVWRQKRNEVSNMFSLGECEHTANLALQHYRELKQQALLLRDRALKITRAKEKLQASGTFAGDEACARAYSVLSGCTEHLDLVDQREHWLQQSREFFAKAENTLTVLEKLEVEFSNVKLPSNSPESFALYAKVARDVSGFTEEALRLGYSILDEVGRTQPETQGVKRVLDEIENRKNYIESICATSNEDQSRVQKALREFLEHYNDLLAWLMSSGQAYLQQHIHMGQNLKQSKQFLLQHHELMQDLEIKGELINLLLESIKTHLESLSPQQRYDVDSKAEALHKHWIELKNLVLKRVDAVSMLIEFFEKANELDSQLENIERQLSQTPNQQKLQFLQETWVNVRNDFGDLKNAGVRFMNIKIVDPYLDTKSSTAAVEDILNGFSKRQFDVSTSLENWTTHITEKREVEVILEKIMSDNEETAAKTTKVDTQLYPVFTSPSLDAAHLQTLTRDKLSYVSKDIEQAQSEIQQRIQTTLAIQTNDQESLQKIEQVISNLRTLKSKLDGIKFDYKALLENIELFLQRIIELRHCVDDHFANKQNHYPAATSQTDGDGIQRIIVEHEKFRNSCMDKFRSLIAQSELLIDRVRVLEPPGAREIDTDRILKLLENLRIHFETGNSERMSQLERLERLDQFKSDLSEINRSLDSVSKQLKDINDQSVDSLAAAKTTSLAFEYFERTIELLEKRIEKFTESTTQTLLITNPESQLFVRDELSKLNEKWRNFKDQVYDKRNSLNKATGFFEIVEKIDAEYREISYFYNSVASKITYLRDPVEAENLVNDIEKYVGSREAPLREKLDNAAKCTHDMNKVSTLYNDVMSVFQSFSKLKSDINIVQDRLKNEERMRAQREREAREQAEREKAIKEAEANERIAREEQARLQALQAQAARDQIERERAALELAAREQAIKEEEARLQAAREQSLRDEEQRLRALREEETRLHEARLEALREQTKREEEARLEVSRLEQIKREEEARLLVIREESTRQENLRLEALREQTNREEVARQEVQRLEQIKRDEEARLQALRDQANLEDKARLEQMKRDEEAHLQAMRDHVDHQRIVTENIRRDIQINQIFTEIKYTSPRFTRLLKDAIAREGDKITLECEVVGEPQPTVEWFKDGISIQSNPDYKTTFDKGNCRLVIEETFTADSARFTCRASNMVGNAETIANLSVRENAAEVQLVPPRIVRPLESGRATEGSTFQFSCVVSGNPLPTVQWYKNDKCIDDSLDYVINYNNGEATLRFEEVFLEDDAVYTCSASNPAGIEHCSASLIVEPLEPTEIPHFKIPLSNAMARVGQKVKLEALIGGIPRPDIFWLHNGKPYHPREMKYEYGRVTLIISQAYPNDAGVFVLTARNLAGEAYSSCNLVVKGRLPNETSDSEMASDMEPVKPSVQMPLKDVSIFEGKPVRLDCVIVGQPEPEVIWYHDERPIKESADVQLLFQGDRCSLIIQEVYQEDGGNYKVVAINSAGEASSSCELRVTPLNLAEPATRAQAERHSLIRELQPKFEKFLTDVLADEGQTVEMEVNVSGDQPLNVKWYLTNKELIENERVSFVTNGGAGVFKLVIQNVNADDKGVYTVKVSNNAGDAKCFSHLIVKSVNVPADSQRQPMAEIVEKHVCPEFKEVFSDQNAHPDEMVKFECIVKGKPTPKVHWLFRDEPVHGHNFLVSTSGERQVLIIQKAGVDSMGKVSCVAENEVGKATCVAFLNLIGPGLQAMMPATSEQQIVTQEHNTDSSRVTIQKKTFTTTSTSQVNTYEGNMPQTEIHHSSAHIDQSLKQLGTQRPEIVESHHYQSMHKTGDMATPSTAQKSFVLVQSASSDLTPVFQASPSFGSILGSPTRTRKQIAPRFTTPLTGKIVDQGTDIHMEATYDGFPSPEIKVEKNGEQLFDNERMKITNSCNRVALDLREVNVSDAGRYAITASNTMGKSTSTADLVVKKTIFPPVFGRRLQAQVVKKGEKVIMEVEVTGLPDPTVVWMKDDKLLSEAGLSEHRLLAQGNSYRLIIEKGQISDSGKYVVKATNSGGEAKSIADCAILEPSPERMQEVVKTIVYETPTSFKTEGFQKEPLSTEMQKSETSTASDLHGLSESKIITEHRCTTEATMRLEHKTAYSDLPELSIQRPKTPNTSTTTAPTDNTDFYSTSTTTTTTTSQNAQKSNDKFLTMDLKIPTPHIQPLQLPTPAQLPPVPPKPHSPVFATAVSSTQFTTNTEASTPPGPFSSFKQPIRTETDEKTTSSSFEYFKKIELDENSRKKLEDVLLKRPTPIPMKSIRESPSKINTQQTLEQDLRDLNLVPGSPPEICFVPKLEAGQSKKPAIGEKIKLLEETASHMKEAPQGGLPLLRPLMTPPVAPTGVQQTLSHETSTTKEVKIEYGQPIMRPAATTNLDAPSQLLRRSPSPKPSAEGVAMSKLWTPTHTASGYESCPSDFDDKPQEPIKLPIPSKDLSAPFLVKQATKSIPIPIPVKMTTDDIGLKPGTPPEICFAPKPTEMRRHSLVETMEKTLEQNLIHGPSKVLPHSIPTLTPTPTAYKPPPPVLPSKLSVGPRNGNEFYESDYESDRWKYSGSESDDPNSHRPKPMDGAPNTAITIHHPIKTSGYAADTEEITSYKKMETLHETRSSSSHYESSNLNNNYQKPEYQPPTISTPLHFQNGPPNGYGKHDYSTQTEFKQEKKDNEFTSSMKTNTTYNIKGKSVPSTVQFAPKPVSFPPVKAPSPARITPSRTPGEFSDYSSEVDERFRSVSRTYESDADIKGYRVVFPPTPTPKLATANGHKSPVVVITPSPMEFEPTPTPISAPSRQKFEPIKTDITHQRSTVEKHEKMLHQQKQQFQQHNQQQTVFKPKPVAAKFLAAAAAQQQQQPQQPYQEPSKPGTIYYNAIAGTPLHTAKMATETKNVMQMKESTETCQRVVNMQQTKRVIHFDSQKEEQRHTTMSNMPSQPLEPFPYTVSPSRATPHRQVRVPTTTPTPTKFVPGDFRESDYESEVENAKIRPLWTPTGDQAGLYGYRHVEPPRPGRACSLPRTYERVLSPMEFDRGPQMPSKIQLDSNSLRRERASSQQINMQNRTQSLNRYSSTRTTSNQQQQQPTVYEQGGYNFPRDDMNLQVGSPPKYGYIQAQADSQAKRMGSTFMQKSHKFIDDITSDFQKTTTKTTKLVNGSGSGPTYSLRPGFKRAPSEGDNRPQAYRNDSRVSQFGTKCVDPDTGLIYFKYDFGYEFGILFPGEGRKFVGSQWNSSSSSLPQNSGRKSPYPLNIPGDGSDLIIPVQHERTVQQRPASVTFGDAGSNSNLSGYHTDTGETVTHRNAMSKNFGSRQNLKKRYSLPNAHNIELYVDRLHANDAFNQRSNYGRYSVSDLPAGVPVNAHLLREEQLQRPPMFITPLKDIAVTAGQTARFECIVQCYPQPDIAWSRDGAQVLSDNKNIVEYRNGVCRLTMPQAFAGNAGTYSCTANNPLGAASTTGTLTVQPQGRAGRF